MCTVRLTELCCLSKNRTNFLVLWVSWIKPSAVVQFLNRTEPKILKDNSVRFLGFGGFLHVPSSRLIVLINFSSSIEVICQFKGNIDEEKCQGNEIEIHQIQKLE